MAQHVTPSRRLIDKPTPAKVDEPFDWSGVKCEWNQNHCTARSTALVDVGATGMIAGQAPTGFRAARHLCRTHLRSYLEYRPGARVIQRRTVG